VYGILGDREKHSKADEEFSTSIVEGLSGYVGVLHHGAFTVRGATLRGMARNRGQRAMIWLFLLCKEEVMFGRLDFDLRPYSLEVPCLLPLKYNFDWFS
jgi:hypothetical protein